jgi:hypothetical protein
LDTHITAYYVAKVLGKAVSLAPLCEDRRIIYGLILRTPLMIQYKKITPAFESRADYDVLYRQIGVFKMSNPQYSPIRMAIDDHQFDL